MTSLHPLTTLLAQTERERDLALADHLRAQRSWGVGSVTGEK